jgi:hypothetical protein
MKRMPHLFAFTLVLLVLEFTAVIHAQMLSGRVYEGEYPSEPPAARGLAGVALRLYGSYSPGVLGDELSSYMTASDGWYGLETEQGYEFYK